MELNDVSQENKILRKKLEAWNQPDQSTPMSLRLPTSLLSPTPSPTLEPVTDTRTGPKTILKVKADDVFIQRISEQHRSGF